MINPSDQVFAPFMRADELVTADQQSRDFASRVDMAITRATHTQRVELETMIQQRKYCEALAQSFANEPQDNPSDANIRNSWEFLTHHIYVVAIVDQILEEDEE